MAYQSNKPQATDLLSQSQSDLLGNFYELNAAFKVNHVELNLGDQGKHTIATFTDQSAVTAPALSALEVGLYNRNGELYLRPKSSVVGVTTTDRPLSLAGKANPGWCMLPSGIIMKWGSITTTNSSSNQNKAYPVGAGIPVFSNVHSVQLTMTDVGEDSFVWLIDYSNKNYFVVTSTDMRTGGHHKASSCTYLAIGD